jgi:hypothetical protein
MNKHFEATLTPEQRNGKEEFDEIHRRYAKLLDEAERKADPRELEMVIFNRDQAEDKLLEKSANARAYVRRVLAENTEEL